MHPWCAEIGFTPARICLGLEYRRVRLSDALCRSFLPAVFDPMLLSSRAANFAQKPALRSFLDFRTFSAVDNVVERGNTISDVTES